MIDNFWKISGEKIAKLEAERNPEDGTPVFTINGQYVAQGWTEWTQGFQFGSAILQYDATGNSDFLDSGRFGQVQDGNRCPGSSPNDLNDDLGLVFR